MFVALGKQNDVRDAERLRVLMAKAQAKARRAALFFIAYDLETETGAFRIYNNFGESLVISKVHLAADTAPTGAAVIVDIHKDGTTIFTNQAHRPTIAAAANTGETTDIDVATWAMGEYLTADIDQAGSTIPGAYLVISVIAS